MMLRITPNIVGDYRSAKPVEPGEPFTPATRGWITKDRSVPGHIGWPHLASVEKGEHLFNAFSADVISLLERVVRWDGKSWNG
jgi:creatinine amidohydrolase